MRINRIQTLNHKTRLTVLGVNEYCRSSNLHPNKPENLLWIICLLVLTACGKPQGSLPKQLVPLNHANAPFASVTPITLQNTIIGVGVHPGVGVQPSIPDSVLLLNELRDLVNHRQSELFSNPGWLHLITRQVNPITGTYMLHQTIWEATQGQFEQEEWILLNDQGQLSQAVTRIKSSDGQILQERILSDGIWRNLTLGSESQADPMETYLPDLGFYQETLLLLKTGMHLSKQTLYNNCWYLGEEYRITDGQKLHTAVINPDTGKLRTLKIWDVSSGQIKLVSSVDLLVEELIPAPPTDVSTLLASQSAR